MSQSVRVTIAVCGQPCLHAPAAVACAYARQARNRLAHSLLAIWPVLQRKTGLLRLPNVPFCSVKRHVLEGAKMFAVLGFGDVCSCHAMASWRKIMQTAPPNP